VLISIQVYPAAKASAFNRTDHPPRSLPLHFADATPNNPFEGVPLNAA
jgi:hypothetical protein